jgi:hypothetical protein
MLWGCASDAHAGSSEKAIVARIIKTRPQMGARCHPGPLDLGVDRAAQRGSSTSRCVVSPVTTSFANSHALWMGCGPVAVGLLDVNHGRQRYQAGQALEGAADTRLALLFQHLLTRRRDAFATRVWSCLISMSCTWRVRLIFRFGATLLNLTMGSPVCVGDMCGSLTRTEVTWMCDGHRRATALSSASSVRDACLGSSLVP